MGTICPRDENRRELEVIGDGSSVRSLSERGDTLDDQSLRTSGSACLAVTNLTSSRHYDRIRMGELCLQAHIISLTGDT